jgi:hypothetical protein
MSAGDHGGDVDPPCGATKVTMKSVRSTKSILTFLEFTLSSVICG